jgi:hypothetical protein
MKYIILARFDRMIYERIDEFDTGEEAFRMLAEYRFAFGDNWDDWRVIEEGK